MAQCLSDGKGGDTVLKNLYKTLGVKKGASKKDMKKAYRKKAQEAHPDAGGSDKKFHALTTAYSVLSDDERREKYDEDGTTDQKMPDSVLKSAVEALIMIFQDGINEILRSPKPEKILSTDVTSIIEKNLFDKIRQKKAEQKNHSKKIKILEKALKKIDDSERFNNMILAGPIASNLSQAKKCKSSLVFDLKVLAKAVVICRKLDYDFDSESWKDVYAGSHRNLGTINYKVFTTAT